MAALLALALVLPAASGASNARTPPFVRASPAAEAYLLPPKLLLDAPGTREELGNATRTRAEIANEVLTRHRAEASADGAAKHVSEHNDGSAFNCPRVLPEMCWKGSACAAHTHFRKQCVPRCGNYTSYCDYDGPRKHGPFHLRGVTYCGLLHAAPASAKAGCEAVLPPNRCSPDMLESYISPFLNLLRYEDDMRIGNRQFGRHTGGQCGSVFGEENQQDDPPALFQPPSPPPPPPPSPPPALEDVYTRGYAKDRAWDVFEAAQQKSRRLLDHKHNVASGYCTKPCVDGVQSAVHMLVLCGTHNPEGAGYAVGQLRAYYGPKTCRGAYQVRWPRGARGAPGDAEAVLQAAKAVIAKGGILRRFGGRKARGTPESVRMNNAHKRIAAAKHRADVASADLDHAATILDAERGLSAVERMGKGRSGFDDAVRRFQRKEVAPELDEKRRAMNWKAEHIYAKKLSLWAKGFAAGMRDALDGMVKEEKAGPTVFARTGDNAGGAVPEKNHLFEIKEYFADKAD